MTHSLVVGSSRNAEEGGRNGESTTTLTPLLLISALLERASLPHLPSPRRRRQSQDVSVRQHRRMRRLSLRHSNRSSSPCRYSLI